jgi:hypothetical protein
MAISVSKRGEVRKKKAISGWGLLGGKRSVTGDKPLCPEVTAAREVEEETHGLIPRSLLLPVLQSGGCPVEYDRGPQQTRFATFYVRWRGDREALVQRFKERVQGKGEHFYGKEEGLGSAANCMIVDATRPVVFVDLRSWKQPCAEDGLYASVRSNV